MSPARTRRSPGALLRAVSRAIRRWAWSREAMLIYELDLAAGTPPAGPADAAAPAIRIDTLDDFRLYTGSIPGWPPERMVAEAARRLAAGEHCDTMVVDGVLAHYGWTQVGLDTIHLGEVDFVYRPGPGAAIIYDVYTEPAMRGRRLFTHSVAHRIRMAATFGATRVVGAVLESNVPSRRGIAAGGQRAIARIVRIRRLGWSRAWLEPV